MMIQPTIETDRLLIRELLPSDVEGMFELDSSPNVHLYLGNQPVKTLAESRETIRSIRQQYRTQGIGRWAVEEKSSGQFVGWTGFKVNTDIEINGLKNLFDLGYRFIESAWGKGYASETGFACLKYAFENLNYDPVYGAADVRNAASNRILQKMGMKFVTEFDFEGDPHYFYQITKTEWDAQNSEG
ncbi:MAG: GNAT family N-acetyltransferase [Gammaproteobacteria bacterium]